MIQKLKWSEFNGTFPDPKVAAKAGAVLILGMYGSTTLYEPQKRLDGSYGWYRERFGYLDVEDYDDDGIEAGTVRWALIEEWLMALSNEARYEAIRNKMVSDAARASEMFSEDELEEFANSELRKNL